MASVELTGAGILIIATHLDYCFSEDYQVDQCETNLKMYNETLAGHNFSLLRQASSLPGSSNITCHVKYMDKLFC